MFLYLLVERRYNHTYEQIDHKNGTKHVKNYEKHRKPWLFQLPRHVLRSILTRIHAIVHRIGYVDVQRHQNDLNHCVPQVVIVIRSQDPLPTIVQTVMSREDEHF